MTDAERGEAGRATQPAPFVVRLALWVGALAAATLRPPLPPRIVETAQPAWRAAASGAGPAALLAVVVLAVVNLALVAALGGRAGGMTSLAILVLQAVSVGYFVPIETAPPFFRALAWTARRRQRVTVGRLRAALAA